MKEYILKITTIADGSSTVTTEGPVHGVLYAVETVDGDLADGVDTTLTYISPSGVTKTLLTLTDWNTDATYYPGEQVHGNTGAALTLDGTRIAFDKPIISGIVTATTAQGGNVKSGAIILYVEED